MLRWGRVEVTGGFLLLLAWLNYRDTQGLLLPALGAACIHELGHWAAIRLLGGCVDGLRLCAAGAEMRLSGSMSYCRELLCALAGPAVNLLLALAAARLGGERGFVFAGMNLALGCFNLLPLSVLDGGRCLVCVAEPLLGPDRMQQVQRIVDRAAAALVLVGGIVILGAGGNVTLLVIALWLCCVQGKGLLESCRKKGLSRGV
ncbi:MAG: site-2 protease family protein [Oscillospiraceae bacterium]|nr:site-2 protease family protein [Oscillospiraceae bacterium]